MAFSTLSRGYALNTHKITEQRLSNLDEMCEDSWKWQMNNPSGYNDEK